jgi:hypothetical protein
VKLYQQLKKNAIPSLNLPGSLHLEINPKEGIIDIPAKTLPPNMEAMREGTSAIVDYSEIYLPQQLKVRI